MSKVHVGNLAWAVNDDILRQAFSQYGDPTDVVVMKDRETGRSKGFGFVTFNTSEEANAAIDGLNESELEGRTIRVNVAEQKKPRNYGGGGGGGWS